MKPINNEEHLCYNRCMHLTAKVKLLPTHQQAEALKQTLILSNRACQYLSDIAWETKTFRQYDLHHMCYRDIRERYKLSAQVTVRVIAKVADAYKRDHKTKRWFRINGGIDYDDRILSWNFTSKQVSIWTVAGRLHIPFICGKHHWDLLQSRKGESILCISKGQFYLHAFCEVKETAPIDVDNAIGVDLGVVNIAVDSDGEVHSARQINNVRYHHRRLREQLQAKGTRSTKRKLKKLSGKERNFANYVNHCISKQLVAKAKDTKRAIALEDLKGIRTHVTVRRSQRAILHTWALYQLRIFVSYKARLAGVPVVLVDPRNTSRTCPVCGHIDKANRPNQSTFSCVVCGFAGLADHVAAINIGRRAEEVGFSNQVNRPNVACDEAEASVSLELRQSVVTSRL